jgi:hypothetical protein
MFSLGKGLFLQRTPKGDVRFIKTYDGRAPREDNVVLDQSVAPEVFAAALASVSKRGESAHTQREALAYLNAPA